MRFVSTRGEAPALGFDEVLLAGLASDGGLYLPETWPRIPPAEIAGLAGKSYQAVAARIMTPFVAGTPAPSMLATTPAASSVELA